MIIQKIVLSLAASAVMVAAPLVSPAPATAMTPGSHIATVSSEMRYVTWFWSQDACLQYARQNYPTQGYGCIVDYWGVTWSLYVSD